MTESNRKVGAPSCVFKTLSRPTGNTPQGKGRMGNRVAFLIDLAFMYLCYHVKERVSILYMAILAY